jgi:hypothetical protein
MYCPNCGQERISEETSFCSRCGFLLTGTSELLRTGGVLPANIASDAPSPRSRGIRQGIFMLLLIILVAPIIGMISEFALRIEPWPMGIAVFLLGGGGILRIAYALMFEPKYSGALPAAQVEEQPSLERLRTRSELPPQQTFATSQYIQPKAGGRFDTKDLEPGSVTDGTTKLLEKESDPPA